MGFIRRKSLATANTEDTRPRRRLSKPMTSKSPPSPRCASIRNSPKSRSGSVSLSSSQMSLTDIARSMSKQESRIKSHSQLFEAVEEAKPKPAPQSPPKRKAVASLVMQFENAAAAASQTSLNAPVSPVKPASGPYAHRLTGLQEPQPLSQSGSRDLLRSERPSMSTMASAAASLELLADPFAIPRRRESKYRPGDATRKAGTDDRDTTFVSKEESLRKEHVLSPSNALGTKSENNKDWIAPPRTGRTDSPSNIDFQAIGGLRLGSLHVVNGRSSPVLSELSRHLISKQMREVSSEYADSTYSEGKASVDWEDEEVAIEAEEFEVDEPSTPTGLSPMIDDNDISINADEDFNVASRTPPKTPVTPDRTSIMAQAYMNELQGSPFSFGTVSPLSTGSVVHHSDRQEMDTLSGEVSALEEDGRTLSITSEQPSIESKPSVPETLKTRDLVFSSALEYQAPHFEPPMSPERGISPVSQRPGSSGDNSGKGDSGYNSGTSMFSFQLNETRTENKQVPSQLDVSKAEVTPKKEQKSSKKTSPKKEESPWRLSRLFPRRPALQKSSVTAPAVPTLATVRTEPIVVMPVITTPIKSTKPPERAMTVEPKQTTKKVEKETEDKKAQKRLQKVRPRSQVRESKEIVVQRLASCESTLDIPAIPNVTKMNLHRRSTQLPELERTFRSQDHIKNQPSISNLDLLTSNIRFPSPVPDADVDERGSRDHKKQRDRSSSRPRSRSRRRSFLDMFKSDKKILRRQDEASREDTDLVIADFGDVVTSLGANPYSISHSRSNSPATANRKKPTPPTSYPSSTENRQRRISMSDEQASEFARARSHSFNGRDYKGDRKLFPNEHGLVLGKYLKTSTTGDDVPPIPPLPGKDELRRISQRHSMQSQYASTPNDVRRMWEQTASADQTLESSPALLHHSYSPQQSFGGHRYAGNYAAEDDVEHAPPPPSHSPAPMDLLPPSQSHSPLPVDVEPESPWNRQARTWRQKRRSANEALESHRQSLDLRQDYMYTEGSDVEDESDLAYPVIPPRHPDRPKSSHQSPARWNADVAQYDEFDHEYQVQRSQTWDEGLHNPYPNGEDHFKISRSSFQSRQRRHQTWDEDQDYNSYDNMPQFSRQENQESRQSNHRSVAGTDSRQTFYSQRSPARERPHGHFPQLSGDSHDSRGFHEQFYTPQASPARGRGRHRNEHEYDQYSNQFHNHQHHGYEPGSQAHDIYNDNLPQITPKRPLSQQYPYFQPTPDLAHSARFSPAPSRPRSQAPQSPARSRPTSRHSRHSTNADVGLTRDFGPEFDQPPPLPPPDFGRYSGGLGFGYEGRDTGFGGSAGTRNGCGKAEGQWKGVGARQEYGVDLADVPFIGVVKRVPVGSR